MADNAAPHARSEYPLLECFFEFWEEVENLRWHVQSPDGGGDPFLPAAAGGREHLADVLRAQRLALANPQAAMTQHQLEEAQYVMAATADELFIGMPWDGAEGWTMRPLEIELFGTRRAGDEIFARIDRLAGGFGPVDTEMATVYLTALELGFTGRHADDRATLDDYEGRLRKLVGRRPAASGPLVAACYEHTTVADSGLRLPASRTWWSTAVTIAALSLLVLIVTLVSFRGSTVEDARQRLETTFGR
jgi:type VI secretion system protein ImpK